ncbi:HdeD family acid-resistance protein [Cystobacter fuscus]
MATPDSSLEPSPRRPWSPSALWTGPLVMGVLVTLLGVLALGSATLTSLLSVLFYGVLLMGAGVLEIVHGLRNRDTGPFLLFVLGGLLSFLVGGFLLTQPGAGLMSLTLLLAAYFFASGFFRILTASSDRHPGWGWDFAQGAVSVMLGALIFSRMPSASPWVLGVVVGVELLTRGLSLLAGALVVRGLMRRTPEG